MYYFLMIFAGGMIGLVVAGPGGSIMGAISGFVIAACEELTGDEAYGANCYSYESPDPDDSDFTHFSDDGPMLSLDDDISDISPDTRLDTGFEINPATCLPMMGSGIGGVDVAGNPYGVDLDSDDISIGSASHGSSIFDD